MKGGRSAAPRCPDRGREGAGPQHARRHQPGAGPRRRRHAEECVAPIAVAPAGEDESEPGRYVRPAVFICDEYQAFASVGEDDPSGDEKAFALTRQCRVIPIVATQSISSLRSVLGSSEAWRTLLQTLRTRIFLSLSDEASAEIASKLCGQVRKLKATYAINETSRQSGINFLSAQAGGRARQRG